MLWLGLPGVLVLGPRRRIAHRSLRIFRVWLVEVRAWMSDIVSITASACYPMVFLRQAGALQVFVINSTERF
jgi:hypothetical protein